MWWKDTGGENMMVVAMMMMTMGEEGRDGQGECNAVVH